ncbi:hypothetical protein [Mesorhizobium sp. ESP-6-2]|uniref:hypothetical protein n=1 Tax=Mesorhizobium sp. ESP-6-2 TaxID=2876625 RepID=UPI001CC93DA4|nr:hypothetical protein [Mesorhizobium sp. ESP-6-2]MBZ9806940.1 hypothetical protein [Mesorhizobium sp. ESP-6-2]
MTTQAIVDIYKASTPIFEGILSEVRELSRKKPEATMSASKVKLVNRVLVDLLVVLKSEPAGKYLDELDEDALPQMSDAVLNMVQFEKALDAFKGKYLQYFSDRSQNYWLTEELQEAWAQPDDEDEVE